ncbi:protein-L-isoaspartate(D-aspartate) O-methyltransferase [Pontibacter flavimaris]|uniref:Protein-L-isoaspartate O-methyltransferase n=1 Tax=Pontibacter flavimaris TaxID=1797110 RepID=A0A1Q5PE50_9BACT|nr:protein-L-isoaspartate(D-aspartate) O-methyltransferase [Pontibacter flavimaris]OKL40441.1 protein-L-isoaspartate O-methyltransferase [Pontibacter flavimaris]
MVSPVSLLLLFILLLPQNGDDYKEKRERMVKQAIAARGTSDRAVLKAMRTVERHLFVPPDQAAYAYEDNPLPIGSGQTISQPYMVAFMTEVIEPGPQMKVLEIGTGNGYQAAVLAEIVKQVYTIEIIPELGKAAAARLKNLGYANVEVKVGNGYHGWEAHAPFDAIVVTAAAETVPPPLIQQLKEGGRMVIPVGPENGTQTLLLLRKKKGKISTTKLMPVLFVPFTGGDKE